MKNKFKTLSVLAASMVCCAGVASALSTDNLADLTTGQGTLTVGDKTFSGFGLISANSSLLAQAQALTVTASVDPLTGIYYLDFGGNLFLDNHLGTGSLFGDVKISYTVTTTGALITMIDQQYTPNGTPSSGQIVIGETAVNVANGVSANSTLTLVPTDIIDPAPEAGDNLLVVPGQTSLSVVKDIGITAFAGTPLIGLSDVQQSFHQGTVPDGGITVALLGFGLMGIEGLRRRMIK